MRKIKIGIIGSGRIVNWMLSDVVNMKYNQYIEIKAIYSDNLKQANHLAKLYHIQNVCKNINELLTIDVDAIYNATPDQFHYSYNKQALLANKHVYCEKPIAQSRSQITELINIAGQKQKLLFHGIKTPFSPAFEQFDNLKERYLGNINHIDANFCKKPSNTMFHNPNSDMIVPSAEWDLGIYPLFIANYLVKDLEIVYKFKEKYPNNNASLNSYAILKNNHAMVHYVASKQYTNQLNTIISGDNGYAIIGGNLKKYHMKYQADMFHMAKTVSFYNNDNQLVKYIDLDFKTNGEGLRFAWDRFVANLLSGKTQDAILTNDLNIKLITQLEEISN